MDNAATARQPRSRPGQPAAGENSVRPRQLHLEHRREPPRPVQARRVRLRRDPVPNDIWPEVVACRRGHPWRAVAGWGWHAIRGRSGCSPARSRTTRAAIPRGLVLQGAAAVHRPWQRARPRRGPDAPVRLRAFVITTTSLRSTGAALPSWRRDSSPNTAIATLTARPSSTPCVTRSSSRPQSGRR